MAFGIFVHRADSIYDDVPSSRYQFPKPYLGRAKPLEGGWVIYYEPSKVPQSRGYFATAKVARIVLDSSAKDMFVAEIEPETYLDFVTPVPLNAPDGQRNERGLGGRAQWAVRDLSAEDFRRIISLGLPEQEDFLPRVGEVLDDRLQEERVPYEVERTIVQSLQSRPKRDYLFRRAVLAAYDSRCAVTGWKLINGGGRAEAEAAHIRPVEMGGPDSVQNGIALSGTLHWMFDRGLIGFSDDLDILISRQVNDRSSVEAMINPTGRALSPERPGLRPHPMFLQWHREHCLKQ
jgi:putative restriction endonuclease